MTDIVELAKKCGLYATEIQYAAPPMKRLKHFADLIREECARVCDEEAAFHDRAAESEDNEDYANRCRVYAKHIRTCAKYIRAGK